MNNASFCTDSIKLLRCCGISAHAGVAYLKIDLTRLYNTLGFYLDYAKPFFLFKPCNQGGPFYSFFIFHLFIYFFNVWKTETKTSLSEQDRSFRRPLRKIP